MGEAEKSGSKPLRRGHRKVRARSVMSFTLGIVARERICWLARQRGVSRSRVIEDLVGGVDYPQMFELFESGARIAQIVIITRQPPAIVRAIYTEYLAVRDEVAIAVSPSSAAPSSAAPHVASAASLRPVRRLPARS